MPGVQHGWVQRLDRHQRSGDDQKRGKNREQLDGVREGQALRERAVRDPDGESDDNILEKSLKEEEQCLPWWPRESEDEDDGLLKSATVTQYCSVVAFDGSCVRLFSLVCRAK